MERKREGRGEGGGECEDEEEWEEVGRENEERISQ